MLRTRSYRFPYGVAPAVLIGLALVSGTVAQACTIPVFRYALERWESDRFLVIVYHDGPLTAEQDSAVSELARRSSLAGGQLNIEVVRYDVTSPSPPKVLDVQPPPADRPLPWVEIRVRLKSMATAVQWEWPLAEGIDPPGLFDSPARSEIVRRILDGHSAVWLLVAPEEQLQQLSEKLQARLDTASQDLRLPSGIGLPGSELYAAIPLEIRYSVLAVSHADPQERQFLKLLGASAEEWGADGAYVIPVFGRCRALDVVPHAEIDELLVEDIATFLCGACSCRVKQANPGFDLLTAANWDQRLFGESSPQAVRAGAQPKAEIDRTGLVDAPEYLAIPIGDQSPLSVEPNSAREQPEGSAIDADQAQSSAAQKVLLLLVVLIVVGGVLARVTFKWR